VCKKEKLQHQTFLLSLNEKSMIWCKNIYFQYKL